MQTDSGSGLVQGSGGSGGGTSSDAPVDPPAGFGQQIGGKLIPQADEVQGPADILDQYGQDSIPAQFPDVIERNRVAGLDAKGFPIPGAPLSPAAQAIVDSHDLATPIVVVERAATYTSGAPSAAVSVTVHPTVEDKHVSWLRGEIEKIVAEYHRLIGEGE